MYYGRSNRVNAAPHPSERPKTTIILPLAPSKKKNKNVRKNIREGRFELPTKGSLRTQMHTLQSSALPLSYPRCAPCIPPCDRQTRSARAGKIKKKRKRRCASTRDRTEDLSVNSRPLCQRSSGGTHSRHSGPLPVRDLAQFPPFGQKVPRPGFEPGSRG